MTLIFRWKTPLYQTPGTVAVCDVPGIGRLYARRLAPRARKFFGNINGHPAIIETNTLDDAKRALETVATRQLNAEALRK